MTPHVHVHTWDEATSPDRREDTPMIRDQHGDPVKYGTDVELVHCAEPGCPDAAHEAYGWRCFFHRKDLDWTCLEPGCDVQPAEGAYCEAHSWYQPWRRG